jgi:hypothetical protein
MFKKEMLCLLLILPLLIACTIGVVQREVVMSPTAVPPTATPRSNAAKASSGPPTPRSTPTPMSASSERSATTLPPEATAFLSRSCPQIDTTTGAEIAVEPCPGDYLDHGDPSSAIVLEEITVETSVCESDYYGAPRTIGTVKAGDPCFLIHGRIKNEHSVGYYVGLRACGYNSAEYQVSWTLDAAHVVGMGLVFVDGRDVEDFTLHLNFAHDLRFIEIGAGATDFPPP